jgi:glycosyltransferase involved in cell wall biosynthesis
MADTMFIIIGEGAMKSQLKLKAIELGVEKSFIFPGQVNYEDLPLWLGATDICAAPYSKSSGLRSPVKIFDYLACARPVIASEIRGATENFRGSGAVILVRPDDPNELSNAIINLLKDDDKMAEMGKAGRNYVEAHYNRASGAAKVLSAIQDTLAKKPYSASIERFRR